MVTVADSSLQPNRLWVAHDFMHRSPQKRISKPSNSVAFRKQFCSILASHSVSKPVSDVLSRQTSLDGSLVYARTKSQNPFALYRHILRLFTPCCRQLIISMSSFIVRKPPLKAMKLEPRAAEDVRLHMTFPGGERRYDGSHAIFLLSVEQIALTGCLAFLWIFVGA